MHAFPHRYRVIAGGAAAGEVKVESQGLEAIATWPPPEFDGPEGHWSPETLLVAAVADCFILSFRAVARASHLPYEQLDVDVEAVLDRVEGVTRFTRFVLEPRLVLLSADDAHRAPAVLDKSKRVCLVTNSLNAECVLGEPAISVAPARVPA